MAYYVFLPEKVGVTHPPCPPPNCAHANNADHFNFYVQVPAACFSSLVLTLKKTFCMSSFFYYFLGFIEGKFCGFSSYQSGNTGCQMVPKLANIAKHCCFPKILPIFFNTLASGWFWRFSQKTAVFGCLTNALAPPPIALESCSTAQTDRPV